MVITRRSPRQPAWHMLASEFSESSLHEKGSGEFDPSFVITKLGAKANRLIVAGLIERLEPRETANGSTLYQGQLRDPSGLHYFSVGDYATEAMREMVIDLAARIESGESLMLLMVAKARWFQNEEGSVYTSLRPEEACIISPSVYREWLAKACEQTLIRLDAQQKTASLETNRASLSEAGIPEHLIDGLILAKPHYGEFDSEMYRFNIMQALDIIENKDIVREKPTPRGETFEQREETPQAKEEPASESDLKQTILELIDALDQGEGVDFDTLLSNAAARGHERDAAEAMLDELSDGGEIHEPRFGWFKRT
jgi:RPA family protein